jgi:cation diffusion facilitator family transporter
MKRISACKAVSTSFLVDLGDIAINVAVMIITGSVVMLAEALEGGADLVASSLLLIGLKISKKRKNRTHPFGYGKALFSWTLISAMVMLIFGAGLSTWFGLKRFLHPEPIEYISLAYVALCISIITNGYSFTISSRRLLEKQHWSKLLTVFLKSVHVETKNTFILDFTGTAAALLGFVSLILYQVTGWQHFDGLGGMLIGLVAGFSSIVLIWGVKSFLIGQRAPLKIEKQIRQAALQVKGVAAVAALDTMYIGSERLLVHLDVDLSGSDSIHNVEILLESIRQHVMKEVPIIYSIHIEPRSSAKE